MIIPSPATGKVGADCRVEPVWLLIDRIDTEAQELLPDRVVSDEKVLVEKMKGRPFVLMGVNGDEDRAKAKEIAAKEGITWRSFWDGGAGHGTALKWGVKSWPTIYLIDSRGIIRDDGLLYRCELHKSDTPDRFVESLVAEAETAAKRP